MGILEAAAPLIQLDWMAQRGFCHRLYHCERQGIILLTVIIPSILSLHTFDGESEISAISTATEPGRHSIKKGGNIFNEEPGRLSWLLLIPVYVIINILIGLACDGGCLPWRNRQQVWSLGEHNVRSGPWLVEESTK